MGGTDVVLDEAKRAHADGDHQFAAELAQLVVRSEPDLEDAKLVKAAALRALGYKQLNPIMRSWYLTGALELEGSIDPDQILGAMLEMLAAQESARETVAGWRYLLDADRAGTLDLSVGIQPKESEEPFTVHLRNSVLTVEDGVREDADAVVEISAEGVRAMDADLANTVTGDPGAYARLLDLLDTEVVGFYMHQR